MNSEVPVKSTECTNNQAATSSNQQNSKLEQKQQEGEQFYPPGRSLCVCPLPKTISREDLVLFLRQFGPVKRQRFRRSSFIIEYYDSRPVEILMSRTNWLPYEKLYLRRKIYDADVAATSKQQSTQTPIPQAPQAAQTKKVNHVPNKTKEDTDPISYERINHVIENQVTFDSQLTALLNEIQLSDAELTGRYNVICPHLNEIFKSVFPGCRTFKFGSTVAGLSFKECDLDIYMYIGETGLPPVFYEPDAPPYALTLSIFKRVRRVMYSMKFIFSNIIAIPKAKTPIIKFRYLPTNVSCDISFKNGLGIYKSNFLRYCASRDARLRPLMLLIKYWAKHLGISGAGRISNYELMSLVIFYLQQESVSLLPPLINLQRNCIPQIINGWQVNFDENVVLPPITNNSSVPELLHNFFSFYATFNFKSHVVCLLDGKTYSAVEFAQVHKLPDYMNRYKSCAIENSVKKLDVDKPMCVQDPIELNQNTAAITPDRILMAFQHCCVFSAEICATTSNNNYDNLLKILFTTVPPNLVQPKKKRRSYKNSISAGRLINAGLPEDFEERTDIIDKEQYKKENWYFIIFSLIKNIFEMIFKLQVGVLLFDKETKQQKIEVLSDVHTKSHQKIIFHCAGNKCVWKNRRKSNRALLDPQLSALEKEAIVSDMVVEALDKKGEIDIELNFTCVLEKVDDPVSVIVTLTDESNHKGQFQQFECFADTFIPKVIDKTLLHMLQFQKTYSQLLEHEET